MHLFHSREREDRLGRMLRAHAYFDLPDNPVCWLIGHRAGVKVEESRYSRAWVRIECRVCGRRYTPDRKWTTPSSVLMRQAGTTSPVVTPADLYRLEQELQQEMADRHVELARRNPAAIVESASGREGYTHGKLELNAELHWWGLKGLKQITDRFGVRLHTGTRGSETPYDAHLHLGFAAAYLSIGGVGHRWAEFIGRGHGRDLSLALHGGHLWWKLWYDGDSGNDEHHRCDSRRRPPWPWSLGRHKHRGWLCLRNGNIETNPVDAWFGSPLYHYDKSEPWRTAIVDVGQFPGDHYLVRFRREPWIRHRDHGPSWARRPLERGVSVEFDAHIPAEDKGRPPLDGVFRSPQPGIPYRNHDWKGDEVLSGGVRPPAGGWPAEWLPAAVDALIASIKADRVRYQYRPPRVDA